MYDVGVKVDWRRSGGAERMDVVRGRGCQGVFRRGVGIVDREVFYSRNRFSRSAHMGVRCHFL